jgi:hypothetical protein
MARFKRYTWVLLGGVFVPVLFVLGFNLLLAKLNSSSDRFLRASEWQEKTHGLTIAQISGWDNGPFKILRLNDRLPNINAVVFGSSTSMGIQADMFPPPIRIYNFTHSANPLPNITGEVQYVLDRFENVRWMFVPIDWAMALLFVPGKPAVVDLSRAHVLQAIAVADKPPHWGIAIKEALSYPKIINLYKIMRAIVLSNEKIGSLRHFFSERSSDEQEYNCWAGVAKDFEPDARSTCFGFQYDGSMDFHKPTTQDDGRALMRDALQPHTFVTEVIPMVTIQSQEPLLTRLAEQARRLQHRGGRMIFYMPPLLPGLEAAILEHPDVGAYKRRTKAIVSQWAKDNKLALLDFGPSENFGCIASEFVDGPHPVPACYRKAFDATWQMHPEFLRLPDKLTAQ